MTHYFKFSGHRVWIDTPESGIVGRYTITIGTLVHANAVIRKIAGKKKQYRIFWDEDYGNRFNKLLRGALQRLLREKL